MDEKDERSFNKTKGTKKINFGPYKRSKVTRIIYVLYITIIIFLCMIILTPQIVGFFQRIFCHNFNYYYCDVLTGYDAVYRLGFAFAIWFVILVFATLGITSSTEKRANVQNGWWTVKTIALILLQLSFVLIPHNEYNGEIWLFFGLNAAFCFIILQYTFILDAANSFCILYEVITENRDGQFSDLTINLFRTAKNFTTGFLYSVSLITSAGFYFMYASYYDCMDNFVFLTFHLIMCLASSVISLLPIVREASPQVGLFQCAVTSLYCTYIIWLALSSEPRTKCNPFDFNRFPGSPMANIQVWVTLFITFSTLIYISIRDLVAPQFGKVQKIDSPVNNSENLKLTYNLQGDGADISQCGNLKGNMKSDNPFTSPKSFDKRTNNLDVSENLKETYDLEGDEDNISPPNILKGKINKDIAFISPKRPFENNKESHSQSKELELMLSSYSPNTDSPLLKTTTKDLSSVNTKNATAESENTSLVWDNTLFLCATTNPLTSYETLPNRPESPVIENSNFTTTGTQESLKLTEANHIAEGAIHFTGKHPISARSKTPGNSSKSSIDSSNFTTTDTEGASTLIASRGRNDITSSSLKCLTNRVDSPLTEGSDFATKGIPESLSLTALRGEREFDKSPINLAEEHFTNTSPKTNHSMLPSLENNDGTTKEIPTEDTVLIWDDEVDGIEYSYPFFHLTFSLATLYLIMSITNWYRLDEGEHLTVRLVQSWSAVWLRISASIFCSFLLIWSMIIPLVFPDTYKDLLFFQYLTSLPKF